MPKIGSEYGERTAECKKAGVSHHSITSQDDYTYVGLYPEVK